MTTPMTTAAMPATHRPAHAHRPPARLLPNTRSPADIAAHTLASARARGAAAVARHAARHVSNASMRALYDGAELRPFDQRAGAMQAFALPSVINGRVVARGGRS